MTKDKNTRRKKRKEKQGIKKSRTERITQWRNSQRLLAGMFASRKFKTATIAGSGLVSRSIWSGMPVVPSDDPFYLCGMEHVFLLYPDEGSRKLWRNETEASFVSFSEYLGSFSIEGTGKFHKYSGVIIQDVDDDSPYGVLLRRQNHVGHYGTEQVFNTVRERKVHFLFSERKPSSQESRLFRSANASVPINYMDGIVRPFREFECVDPSSLEEVLMDSALINHLSDPEVDRIWEFSSAVSQWLCNVNLSVEMRNKEKAALEKELEIFQAQLEEAPGDDALKRQIVFLEKKLSYY
jgi:hypothetical protein